MKRKTVLIAIVALLGMATTFAQTSVTLTFTCQTTDGGYLQPDSITIENLSRNWVETIYYPDTVYILNVGTSVPNRPNDNGMQVMPNPFDGTTRVNVQSSKTENVKMTLTDMGGRVCAEFSGLLQKGGNLFNITLTTPQTYLLSVQTSSGIRSLKMENTGRAGANRIAYEGATGGNMPTVQLKSSSNHPFQLGDEMRYQGFATNLGAVVLSNPVMHAQNTDKLIVLVFPDWSSSDNDGLPCPGAPTITDIDGNVYNTVQIGNQCWMHENLRTTKYADGSSIPSSVDTGSAVDPYYYDYSGSDIPIAERGYLYNWFAAMQGAVNSNALPTGIQGICPNGWHLPSYTEWMQLKDYVSSRSEYQCNGGASSIAKALAATSWWDDYPNHHCTPGDQSVYSNNATNFSAVPAGEFVYFLDFDFLNGFGSTGYAANFWSATKSEDDNERAYLFSLSYVYETVTLDDATSTLFGNSVRCLRD